MITEKQYLGVQLDKKDDDENKDDLLMLNSSDEEKVNIQSPLKDNPMGFVDKDEKSQSF